MEPATATPQGFACLTITHAGSSNSRMQSRAALRSLRLLYESARPCSCSTCESRCRRAPQGRDMRKVLRGGAQHRGPADVDHLDSVFFPHAVPRDRVAERIEVDADEVERPDLVFFER